MLQTWFFRSKTSEAWWKHGWPVPLTHRPSTFAQLTASWFEWRQHEGPNRKEPVFQSLSHTIERIFVCWFVCFSRPVAFFSPPVAVRGIGDKAGSWASGGTLRPSRGNGAMRACFLNTRSQDPGIWGIGLASGGGMWEVDFTIPVWWSDFEHLNRLKAGSSLDQDNLSEIQTRLGQFLTLKCKRLPLAYSKKCQSFGITISRPPLRLFSSAFSSAILPPHLALMPE